jgi:hypothetical protein
MTLRQMMIESIAEFEMSSGNTLSVDVFNNISDQELMKLYRNNVWDEAYTDGHVEGYFKGIDHEREVNKKTDSKVRLN